MTQADSAIADEPSKRSGKPLIIGMVLMALLGGGAFFALWSGLILAPHQFSGEETHATPDAPLPDIAFLPIAPLVISLAGPDGAARHLRFAGQIEVRKDAQAEVALLMPRIVDVLNDFLRAVDAATFEEPDSLLRLRAQMLRRIKLVTGEERVRDLLVSEYVIN